MTRVFVQRLVDQMRGIETTPEEAQLLIAEIRARVRYKSSKQHNLSCPAYNNYQPPYEECGCGVDDEN